MPSQEDSKTIQLYYDEASKYELLSKSEEIVFPVPDIGDEGHAI